MNVLAPGDARPRQPLRPRRSRRPWSAVLVALVLTVSGGGYVAWQQLRAGAQACYPSLAPLAAEQIARLQSFHAWLLRNHAAGYVGEVGWPGNGGDADRWNAVADAWYRAADRDQLWVTAWSAGAGWAASYPMAVYRLGSSPGAASAADPQAAVVAAHQDPGSALRGVDVPSGAFGTVHDATGRYSDLQPGVYGTDYYYPTGGQYRYLAAQGVRVVRLSFTWERLQPRPGGPLDPVALHRLAESVYDASTAGVAVILELHSFGGFWHADSPGRYPQRLALGSDRLPTQDLADLWRRLSLKFATNTTVIGYDLMNEPGDLAPTAPAGAAVWERASQQAVTAVRSTGDAKMIAVEAYGPSGPEQFTTLQPTAWIKDPLGAIRYEVHQYFDSDGSGRYQHTLPYESKLAQQQLSRQRPPVTVPTDLACATR